MKEKQLLRSYKFREYLAYLDIDRHIFKTLPNREKARILVGYKNVMGVA